LLQEIYNSLDKELNQFSEISPIISQALKLNDNNYQHSVFAIININKGAKLELKRNRYKWDYQITKQSSAKIHSISTNGNE
jgi:hypothetical protein